MIVLDTNVISYIFRGDHRGEFYKQRISGERPIISFQTLEEVWFGAYSNQWGERRRQELAGYLQQFEVAFPNSQVADICARLRAERQSSGRKLRTADAWVAATALFLACPLATHDSDFDSIPNLQLIKSPEA